MTFDNDTEAFHVGKCRYTIFEKKHKFLQPNGYIELPENVSDLNEFMCGLWNRKGYLCSRCKKGYPFISKKKKKINECDMFHECWMWMYSPQHAVTLDVVIYGFHKR